jgi:hypothetical protein
MTDDSIEAKALALVNEVLAEWGVRKKAVEVPKNSDAFSRALLRAIEQHEAFKQEVSDAAEEYIEDGSYMGWDGFDRFIIPKPKPDPLLETLKNMDAVMERLEAFRAALEALEIEILEKVQ